MTIPSRSSFWQRPATRLGWWAVGLAITFAVMNFINSTLFVRFLEGAPWRQTVMPFYGVFMMLCGLAAGVCGLMALILNHERSWLVWLAILFGGLLLLFVLCTLFSTF